MTTTYEFFASAKKCASTAAPRFVERKWRWSRADGTFIPNLAEILKVLSELAEDSKKYKYEYVSTGRLLVKRVGDKLRYGVQR